MFLREPRAEKKGEMKTYQMFAVIKCTKTSCVKTLVIYEAVAVLVHYSS